MAAPTVQEFLRKCVNDADENLFTDDELQAVLDLHKSHVLYDLLSHDDNRKRYFSSHRFLTDVTIWDSSDEDNQTQYTPDTENLLEGWFEFTSEQTVNLYLKAYSYNVYAAASDCWLMIASTKFELFSNMIGGTQETLSQIYEHAMEQHEMYKRRAYPPGSKGVARRYE